MEAFPSGSPECRAQFFSCGRVFNRPICFHLNIPTNYPLVLPQTDSKFRRNPKLRGWILAFSGVFSSVRYIYLQHHRVGLGGHGVYAVVLPEYLDPRSGSGIRR